MKDVTEKTYLYDWYRSEYPEDDGGIDIHEDATFYDLFEALDHYRDVYDVIGVPDSLIRERLFAKLADIMKVDYDYIYDQWVRA